MPNIKSAAKRDQLSKLQNAKNKAQKTELKTNLKKFNAAVSEGDRNAADSAYKVAVSSVDRAASKGILHKNNAARKKSQLALKLNELEK
ncbi:MAG: 30S ribosomal protein S20 [Oscillospiraceae bacterium]|nr:30S ribosomal protein S20 [Oscillospiraceae bacterium]